ncbi:unnamed protein product, partial [Iphiclides podalirius]
MNGKRKNYIETRTHTASFPNSVVFPGGVCEAADADERHVALRITAIRETFEELGLLICSKEHKNNRKNVWASLISDIDIKEWQSRVSKNPADLLVLCKEYNCYPDIWSLHYWSNWLTPISQPKRFDTAFFISGLETKQTTVTSDGEVVNVEWFTPTEVLEKSVKKELLLYPPQAYELKRLSYLPNINELLTFSKNRSCQGNELLYPIVVKAKDGLLQLLPGDHLYPSHVNYYTNTVIETDKTILELRENNQPLHRIEVTKSGRQFVINNYKPENHINMNNIVIPFPLITV